MMPSTSMAVPGTVTLDPYGHDDELIKVDDLGVPLYNSCDPVAALALEAESYHLMRQEEESARQQREELTTERNASLWKEALVRQYFAMEQIQILNNSMKCLLRGFGDNVRYLSLTTAGESTVPADQLRLAGAVRRRVLLEESSSMADARRIFQRSLERLREFHTLVLQLRPRWLLSLQRVLSDVLVGDGQKLPFKPTVQILLSQMPAVFDPPIAPSPLTQQLAQRISTPFYATLTLIPDTEKESTNGKKVQTCGMELHFPSKVAQIVRNNVRIHVEVSVNNETGNAAMSNDFASKLQAMTEQARAKRRNMATPEAANFVAAAHGRVGELVPIVGGKQTTAARQSNTKSPLLETVEARLSNARQSCFERSVFLALLMQGCALGAAKEFSTDYNQNSQTKTSTTIKNQQQQQQGKSKTNDSDKNKQSNLNNIQKSGTQKNTNDNTNTNAGGHNSTTTAFGQNIAKAAADAVSNSVAFVEPFLVSHPMLHGGATSTKSTVWGSLSRATEHEIEVLLYDQAASNAFNSSASTEAAGHVRSASVKFCLIDGDVLDMPQQKNASFVLGRLLASRIKRRAAGAAKSVNSLGRMSFDLHPPNVLERPTRQLGGSILIEELRFAASMLFD